MLDQKNTSQNPLFIKFIFIVTAVMVFLSPLLYVDALHNPSALPRSALLGAVSSVFLLGFIWFLFKDKLSVHISSTSILLFIFVLWSSVSLLWSEHKPNSYIELVLLWGLFIVFLFASQLRSGKALKNIVILSVIAASIAALIGILQNWGVEPIALRYELSMGSTFHFRTHATLYLDLIFPVSLVLILIAKNTRSKLFFSVMSGCILGYLLESHTRGSWLALIGLVVILLLFFAIRSKARTLISKKLRKSWRFVILVALIGFTVLIIPGQVEERWQQKTEKGVILDSSSSVRLVNYRNSLDMFVENPVLGVGYGGFWKAFREYMNHPTLNPNSYESRYMYRLHNDLYQIFLELGLIGGLLAIGFYFFSIRAGISAIGSDIDDDDKLICFGLILALLASGIHSMVDFPLHKPSSAIQIFLWLGLLASFEKTKVIALDFLDKNAKILMLLIALVYVIATQTFYYKYLSGNHYFYKADIAIENGDCEAAKKYIDQSHQYFDFYFFSHLHRVDIYVQCEKSQEKLFNVINEELIWDDSNIQALLKRGDIYYQLGLYDRSLKDYSRVVAILPHRPLGAFKQAAAKIALGDIQTGVMELKRLEQAHPDYKPVKDLLRQLNVDSNESFSP